MVATAFAIVAATVQAISVAWQDRKSAKSKNPLSESVQERRASVKNLWNEMWAMLQEFKYWLVEASRHEPLKTPKVSEPNGGATYLASSSSSSHRTFKEVSFSCSTCDRCKDPARSVKYQCEDCDQGYCATCWPRARKYGAHLEDTTGEQLLDSKHHHSVELRNLEPPRSAASSSHVSPSLAPTAYTPLPHIEEGNFSFSPNI